MPTSTRLDKDTEDILKKASEYLGTTKSKIVRESIREYCMKIVEERKKSPWEIYQTVYKAGGSGHGQRILMGREILKKKLTEKRKKWSL
jgi:hypothetical protein